MTSDDEGLFPLLYKQIPDILPHHLIFDTNMPCSLQDQDC